MRYAIRHWPGLVVFLDDGRVEMDTNVVERAIRPSVLTRKNALFAGSDGGARHWAVAMTLIQTAKLNGVEPMGWLTDVLERVVSGRTKAHELHTLLPWEWLEQIKAEAAVPDTALRHKANDRPPRSSRTSDRAAQCRPADPGTRDARDAGDASTAARRRRAGGLQRDLDQLRGRRGRHRLSGRGGGRDGRGGVRLHHPSPLRPTPATRTRDRRLPEAPREAPAPPRSITQAQTRPQRKRSLPHRLRRPSEDANFSDISHAARDGMLVEL